VTVQTESTSQTRSLQAGSGFLSQHSKDVFSDWAEPRIPCAPRFDGLVDYCRNSTIFRSTTKFGWKEGSAQVSRGAVPRRQGVEQSTHGARARAAMFPRIWEETRARVLVHHGSIAPRLDVWNGSTRTLRGAFFTQTLWLIGRSWSSCNSPLGHRIEARTEFLAPPSPKNTSLLCWERKPDPACRLRVWLVDSVCTVTTAPIASRLLLTPRSRNAIDGPRSVSTFFRTRNWDRCDSQKYFQTAVVVEVGQREGPAVFQEIESDSTGHVPQMSQSRLFA